MIDALTKATSRLDEIRAAVRWAGDPTTHHGAARRAADQILAASFVGVCATTEEFFRFFVKHLADTIQQRNASPRNLRLSLHVLLSGSEFRALGDLRDADKVLEKRLAIVDLTAGSSPRPFILNADELGTSGESVRPRHVARAWKIFALPGTPFGSVQESVSMTVVADNRNDYAHGQVPLSQFLQSPECKSTQILARIDALEDWMFHCWMTETLYFSTRGYRR